MEIREESIVTITEYAHVPSAFFVDRILRVHADPATSSRWNLVEEPCPAPFTKDYDAIPDNHPTDWPRQFDTTTWRLFAAYVRGRRVGGAILISPRAPSVGDEPASELWDLRVHPEWQRQGIATALWNHVESAVRTPLLRAETQDINVRACAFYAAQGCTLVSVEPFAYPSLPNETRLVWQKRVEPRGAN